MLDQDIEDPETLTINLDLGEDSLRSVLRRGLAPYGLTYVIRDEIVLITTVAVAEELLDTRVYCVGWAEAARELHELKALISSTVLPEAWSEEGGLGVIQVGQGCLVVTQTQRAHEGVADLLYQLEPPGLY